MGRVLLVAGALALVFATAAHAQDDEPEPTGTPVPAATPTPGCDRGPGTDADYAYCPDPVCPPDSTDADYVYGDRCCRPAGTDADYVYSHVCPEAAAQPSAPQQPESGPTAIAQPLAANSLPVTGAEPLVVALLGLGLVLTGTGLRLRPPVYRSDRV